MLVEVGMVRGFRSVGCHGDAGESRRHTQGGINMFCRRGANSVDAGNGFRHTSALSLASSGVPYESSCRKSHCAGAKGRRIHAEQPGSVFRESELTHTLPNRFQGGIRSGNVGGLFHPARKHDLVSAATHQLALELITLLGRRLERMMASHRDSWRLPASRERLPRSTSWCATGV